MERVYYKRGREQFLLHWIAGMLSAIFLILRTSTGRFPGYFLIILKPFSDKLSGTQPHYAKYFCWKVMLPDISKLCAGGVWKLNLKKYKQCYILLGMFTETHTWKQTALYLQEQRKNSQISSAYIIRQYRCTFQAIMIHLYFLLKIIFFSFLQ